MKRKYDIDEIKRLLDAYYEGNTSIEQEKLLCDFFATATDLPAEFEPDRELFATLQAAIETDIDIPSDLEQRLISHIDNLEANETDSRKKWIKSFAAISAAASIVILFVIALKFIPGKELSEELSGVTAVIEEIEEVDDSTEAVDIVQKDDNVKLVEETITEEEPVVIHNGTDIGLAQSLKTIDSKAKPKPKKKRVKRNKVTAPHNHKPISDEKLAYENTEKALFLLSKNLNKAQAGLNKTESTINEVNNTITDII